MLDAILTTLLLGILAVAISVLANRTWISAVSTYWMIWLLALLSADYASSRDVIPEISDASLSLIIDLHWGAFLGGILASILAGPVRVPAEVSLTDFKRAMFGSVDKYFKPVLIVLFVIAVLNFAENLSAVGFNPASLMTDLRLHFLEEQYSFLGKIGSYAFTSTLLIAILLGYSDAYNGVRFKRLLLMILVTAIQGISFGGRGFLASMFLGYGASFLLATSRIPRISRRSKQFWGKAVGYLAGAFAVFVFLGYWRWGAVGSEDDSIMSIALDMATHWLGLSIAAVEGFVETMKALPLGYGAYVFEWPVVQLNHLGLVDTDVRGEAWQSVMAVRETFGMIGNAPPTIIPRLVADFGIQLMPVYMGLLMAFCQWATIRLRAAGLIRHVVAVLALLACFFSTQDAAFLTAGNSFVLIWTFIFYFLVQRKRSLEKLRAGLLAAQSATPQVTRNL